MSGPVYLIATQKLMCARACIYLSASARAHMCAHLLRSATVPSTSYEHVCLSDREAALACRCARSEGPDEFAPGAMPGRLPSKERTCVGTVPVLIW